MSERLLRWLDAHLVLLLAVLFLIRVGFLLVNGLDLIGDESYYWDWSRQPDWCYYSKPPMVAWLIGAVTWLFGDETAIVRLPAAILGTIFLSYFHATTKAFFGPRAATLAIVLILATPVNVLANFLMTIDPPLFCFWIISLYYLRRALFDRENGAWFWAGLATAAGLLSKQAALLLPLMLLIFLWQDRDRRAFLRREYWIYLLPIVLAGVPILFWNQQHDWVMFGHSKSHFGNHEEVTLVKHLRQAGDFLLYQALLISPVIFVVAVISSVRWLIQFKVLSAEQRFLFLMGPVLLLAVMLLSVLQKVQGNWPMPFYFAVLILLAGDWVSGRWRKALKAGVLMGYFLVGLTYVLPPTLQALNLQQTALDPTKRFKHWRELATNIHFERMMSMDNLNDSFVVALGHRYLASELAFYLPDHPKVYRYEASGQISSQYEVWPGPLEFIGKSGFVVSEERQVNLPRALTMAFERFRFVAEVANPGRPGAPYYLYLGENLKFWPDPIDRSKRDVNASSEN